MMVRAIAACAALGWAGVAAAQPQRAEPRPATKPAASVAATPQQTTATFGDWTLRCAQPAGAPKSCEVVYIVQQDGKPLAELAIGAPAKGKPTVMSALVPTNVSFGAPALVQAPGGDGVAATLVWQRCLPGGCIAGAEIGEDVLTRVRGWAHPGRLTFANAMGQSVTLPISPTGLPQALDALVRENAG